MEVKEKSTSWVTAKPLDRDGKPLTPTNARYRLDDKKSGNAIIAWTTIGTPSDEMEIQIPADDNAIINTNNKTETKVVTWECDFGTDDAQVGVIEYDVVNLQFVT